jgi:hypothetical protein
MHYNTCTCSACIVVHVLVKIKLLLKDNKHGEYNVKFGKAQEAKVIHKYRTIKEKLYKTNASIWFNKTCSCSACVGKNKAIT